MKGAKQLTIVIKIGTSSIVDEATHQPILSILSMIVETAIKLLKDGHRVIIVSSGAIGVGLRRMDIEHKPKHLPKIQALAAIGQCRLMSLWDSLFNHMRQPVAQILLTRNDIADRTQYVNAQNTLSELLNMGVIPIVNENDTLAVAEIKFGDNDTLSAITAAMVSAHYLFLMTDVDCLYDKNPRTHPDATPLPVISDISTLSADVSSAGSSLGTGGMSTKIVAARLATSAGVTTIITRSSRPDNISKIVAYTESLYQQPSPSPLNHHHHHDHLDGLPPSPSSSSFTTTTTTTNTSTTTLLSDFPLINTPLHTRFTPSAHPIRSRSFWLLHSLVPHGTLYIDAGALLALSNGAGLLPAGVLGLDGHFAQQEAVRLVLIPNPHKTSHSKSLSLDGDFTYHSLGMVVGSGVGGGGGAGGKGSVGEEVGRAVVNYSSAEVGRIRGVRSSQIGVILGYADSEYVCLRENIGLFKQEKTSRPGTPGAEGARRSAGGGGGGGGGHGSGGSDERSTPERVETMGAGMDGGK